MGLWNPRAFCPNCGGKIHTQSRGAQSWTGTSCPLCGVALTGRVRGNRAELGTPGAQPLAGPGAAQPPASLVQAVGGLILIGLVIAGIAAAIQHPEIGVPVAGALVLAFVALVVWGKLAGDAVLVATTRAPRPCAKCGAPLERDALTCTECGQKYRFTEFTAGAIDPDQQGPSPADTSPAAEVAEPIRCTACGEGTMTAEKQQDGSFIVTCDRCPLFLPVAADRAAGLMDALE